MPAKRVAGQTFELVAPWEELGMKQPPESMRALVRVEREDGAILQAPLDAKENQPETWLDLTLAP